MLAPAQLSSKFKIWNAKHKAPSGPAWIPLANSLRVKTKSIFRRTSGNPVTTTGVKEKGSQNQASHWKWSLSPFSMRLLGPFAFQTNSATRMFEYPWIFYTVSPKKGMRIIDLGAGASGLQFVMAKSGADVNSVDPLINPDDAVDWVFTEVEFEKLNRAFGNRVVFVKKLLEDAGFEASSVDCVVACSVIEHIPEEHVHRLMEEVSRVLKSGGRFVATIDLFLDCYPFSKNERNKWGMNINVKSLIEASNLRIVVGTKEELFGYEEFDHSKILASRDSYFVKNNVMTQCIVLQKD